MPKQWEDPEELEDPEDRSDEPTMEKSSLTTPTIRVSARTNKRIRARRLADEQGYIAMSAFTM
jgi:hypothetical protein